MTKQVNVVALRAFEYDGELRTKSDKPFSVDGDVARQLAALGVLRIVGGDVPQARAPSDPKKDGSLADVGEPKDTK